MTLEEFENEMAGMCNDHEKASSVHSKSKCGSGFCKAWQGHECKSIPKVREWVKEPGVVGVVLFRNMAFDSSSFGASSCIVVGEGRTYKTIEECEGKWLKDLPSQRQYAESFVRANGGVAA